ncbi:MAG: hypothetical protein ACI4UN_08605 [Muribaculaceae bacterium]
MGIKRFNLAFLLFAAFILGNVAPMNAQGRPRPRPVYRPQYVHTTSSPSYDSGTRYKGFIETGYSGGIGDYRANQLDILTTHGIATGNLFLGVGFGVNILYPNENGNPLDHNVGGFYPSSKYDYNKETAVMIPLYVDFKYNFGSGSVRPFVDFKVGAAFLGNDHAVSIGDGWLDDEEGLYFSPTIGINIPTSGRAAINIGLTYNLISQKYYYYDWYYDEVYSNDGISLHSLGVKLSIEW